MRGRRDPAGAAAIKAPVRSTKVKPPVAEFVVAEGTLKAPTWLKDEGLAIWRRLGPILRNARMLQAADEPAFARYCRNFALWIALRKKLDKDGYTYEAETTAGGKLRRVDPNFAVSDRLERQLLAVEDRFGMSPSERQRIIVQRAAGPGQGGLPFGDPDQPAKRDGDPAAPAAPAAQPDASPIGMLTH